MAQQGNRGGSQMPPAPSHSPEPAKEEVKAKPVVEPEVEEQTYPKTEGEQHSKVIVPEVAKGVEVVAIRDGFHKHQRRPMGSVFMVSSMAKVGDWMKCTDPELEKEHVQMMKEKKLKEREEKNKAAK